MAQGTIKISQISKDLNLKSKDVIDALKLCKLDKKSGATITAQEFDMLMQQMTVTHQIRDIDAYLSGKTSLTVEREKPQPKAEPAAASKQAEAEPRQAAPAQPAPQERAAQAAQAPVHTDAPTQRPAPAQRPATPSAEQPRPAAAGERREQAPRPQQGQGRPADRTGTPTRTDGRPYDRARPADNRQGTSGQQQRPQHSRYNATDRAPYDPFAKRREDMNRAAQGYRKPGQAGPSGRPAQPGAQRPATPAGVGTPRPAEQRPATPNPVRPAQQQALERQKQAEERARIERERAAQQAAQPKKKEESRPAPQAQRQQFRTLTPTPATNAQGGVNLNGEYQDPTAQKKRVVDMRTSDVNLSKYDDRFNDRYYAIINGSDSKASKQKLKKQDNRGQNAKSAKDKERAAQERIKRMQAEKARQKQLEFTVPDEITVAEFSQRLKKSSAEVIKKLIFMGEMKGVNDVIDYATAELLADEFGAKITREIVITKEERLFNEAEDTPEELVERAPVVCVMGHVDHGKTSILDAIRHTSVTKGEAGGITQAIGAYRVKAKDKDITFLDTPGHEAFTAMRMRGAQSTDIAILVVAADDGVMPQTVEAINHAKAAGIDIIVAINKMDKPHANPDNVLNQLTQYELVPEAWGGDVICVPVSALTGMGIEELLESVLLVAEVKELRANPNRRAKGLVIESKLDRGRGPVATVLVQNGTLHQGDYVIVGNAVGRVRAMVDDKGRAVKVAGPSVPVELVGLDDVPQAGDELNAVEDERMAKSLAEERREKARQELLNANARVNLDDLFSQIADGVKCLNVIVKADVAGSAEAVKASLLKLSNEEVKVSVIHSAVGGITESDVMLATASNAIIVGFNVRPDKNALDSAERNKVDIRTHRIIYEIIDEVEAALKGMLAPTYREALLGHAEVRQTIRVPNVGTIAGSYILDGKVTRQAQIRVVRDGVVIFEDKISSLRRFKDDVKEVAEGYECGIGLDKFNDIKEGDILEAFIMEEVAR